jgi:RNA polymerase sigma-70 factor (ECF subfamily)
MHNTWINAYRKTQCRPVECFLGEISDWQLAAHDHLTSTGLRSTEVEVLEALPDSEIAQALDSLPYDLRLVIYYADVGGYRYREIAEIMGTPIGTVMSRLHSARRRLRSQLAELARERGLARSSSKEVCGELDEHPDLVRAKLIALADETAQY